MSELVAFLRARLGEDEQMALAVAGSGGWSAYIEGGDDGWAIEDEAQGDPGAIIGDGEVARHIARHDPKRVMADVAAKRRIIAELAADPEVPDEPGLDEPEYGCGYGRALHDVAKILALPYAGHADYQEAWRV